MLRVYNFRCTFRSQSLSDWGAAYTGRFPCGLVVVRTSLPPFAMCAALPRSDYYEGSARRRRRRWTWQLAELRRLCAPIEVPMFTGGPHGAVGGWLCPWQRGPSANSAKADGVPHERHTQSPRLVRPGSVCDHPCGWIHFHTEGSNTSFIVQ